LPTCGLRAQQVAPSSPPAPRAPSTRPAAEARAPGAQIVRQRLPDWPSRQRLEVVGHRVNQPVRPGLIQVAGAEVV
jgi:hypothetical protein